MIRQNKDKKYGFGGKKKGGKRNTKDSFTSGDSMPKSKPGSKNKFKKNNKKPNRPGKNRRMKNRNK